MQLVIISEPYTFSAKGFVNIFTEGKHCGASFIKQNACHVHKHIEYFRENVQVIPMT